MVMNTVRGFLNLQDLGIKKKIFIGSVAGIASQLQKQRQRQTLSPSGRHHGQGCAPGKALWHERHLVLPGFQQRDTPRDSKCQGYSRRKSWCPNPGSWIPKPRFWIMSFTSWAQIGSPSVCPMHWPSLSYMDTHPLKRSHPPSRTCRIQTMGFCVHAWAPAIGSRHGTCKFSCYIFVVMRVKNPLHVSDISTQESWEGLRRQKWSKEEKEMKSFTMYYIRF